MNIEVVTPSLRDARSGNTVTAERWAGILRELGHRVTIQTEAVGDADLLVALHASKSAASVERFGQRNPTAPIVVGLAGTDLYGDLDDPGTRRSLELATRLVLLQALGLEHLPARFRDKARVIHQSARAANSRRARAGFPVCVVGNLREVKDPLRAAVAARLLPESSRISIHHAGAALSDALRDQALAETAANPRYEWLDELGHTQTLELIAGSRCLVHTSRAEGGANVLSEALAASVPILSSCIPGSVGILGPDYPGLFPAGDSPALAALLHRLETEPEFYRKLQACCARRSGLADPARERGAWDELLAELQARRR